MIEKATETKNNVLEEEIAKKSIEKDSEESTSWIPKTELGRMVRSEKFLSIEDIWVHGKVIKEPEIVNFFFNDLEERILKIGKAKRPFSWVQRMTDSGRRNSYFVMAAVGSRKGYVGVGHSSSREYRIAIEQAIRHAKLNITKVPLGCGSWACGCSTAHSIARETSGKCGSVRIILKPAPKGTGLVVNSIAKEILELAGVKDLWSETKGSTKSRPNMVWATFSSLKALGKFKT